MQSTRSKWHELKGLTLREEGKARDALVELREAARIAADIGDHHRLCSSQICCLARCWTLRASRPASQWRRRCARTFFARATRFCLAAFTQGLLNLRRSVGTLLELLGTLKRV